MSEERDDARYTHPLDSGIVAAICIAGAVIVVAWAVGKYCGIW